jgi:hypothetical protein
MVDATVSDGDSSDNDGNNEEAVVAGGEENAITRIMQKNVLLEHESDSVLSETDIRQECKEELRKCKKYIPEVPSKGKFPDPIAWWKKCVEKRFLRLAVIAHKYLSIQATSAP